MAGCIRREIGPGPISSVPRLLSSHSATYSELICDVPEVQRNVQLAIRASEASNEVLKGVEYLAFLSYFVLRRCCCEQRLLR